MSVADLINQITDQNFKTAEVTLNDLLADKMNDALEQEKIAVANQIYNGVEEDDEQLEMDFDKDEDDFEDAEEIKDEEEAEED